MGATSVFSVRTSGGLRTMVASDYLVVKASVEAWLTW
jgi:hypothetical protein